jgi:hypothetical protein
MATIYAVLAQKLNRTPTHSELKAEVRRILNDGLIEATKGKLSYQRRRRHA